MHNFPIILVSGALVFAGCSSHHEKAIFRPLGWENASYARKYLSDYKHVLVARIDNYSWEDKGPPALTPYHFRGTVVRTFKGDWRVAEHISFVHYVDAPAPTNSPSNVPSAFLVFVFTNEHSNTEIGLYTGEWGHYREELAVGLEYLYPVSR
jgi:hypothetical protein